MKIYRLGLSLAALLLTAAASPSQIAKAATGCGLAADDLAWTSLDATTLSITRVNPKADPKKMLCFGKWLRDNGIRMGLLGRPVDPD